MLLLFFFSFAFISTWLEFRYSIFLKKASFLPIPNFLIIFIITNLWSLNFFSNFLSNNYYPLTLLIHFILFLPSSRSKHRPRKGLHVYASHVFFEYYCNNLLFSSVHIIYTQIIFLFIEHVYLFQKCNDFYGVKKILQLILCSNFFWKPVLLIYTPFITHFFTIFS